MRCPLARGSMQEQAEPTSSLSLWQRQQCLQDKFWSFQRYSGRSICSIWVQGNCMSFQSWLLDHGILREVSRRCTCLTERHRRAETRSLFPFGASQTVVCTRAPFFRAQACCTGTAQPEAHANGTFRRLHKLARNETLATRKSPSSGPCPGRCTN